MIERPFSLDSTDPPILSFEGLDDLLLRSSVIIENEDELLRHILNLGSCYRFLLKHIQFCFLSAEGLSLLADHFEIPPQSIWEWAAEVIAHPSFSGSLIISDFPTIFAEFRGKHFQLLWRGSRDGFSVSDFHGRCDGHANTLTVILDRKGNIFGGFTPVEWESRKWDGKYEDEGNCWKADDSRKSFLFTLKNPHNIGARRFELTTEKKDSALWCCSTSGPIFGNGIAVYNHCNARTDNWTSAGTTSLSSTTLDYPGNAFFAGSGCFKIEEIEQDVRGMAVSVDLLDTLRHP
jgi:hypothetical protein